MYWLPVSNSERGWRYWIRAGGAARGSPSGWGRYDLSRYQVNQSLQRVDEIGRAKNHRMEDYNFLDCNDSFDISHKAVLVFWKLTCKYDFAMVGNRGTVAVAF